MTSAFQDVSSLHALMWYPASFMYLLMQATWDMA
jgi:hypothetical protein